MDDNIELILSSILTVLSSWLYYSSSQKLSALSSSVKDVDTSLPLLKMGSEVLVKGTVSISGQGLMSPLSENSAVIRSISTQYLSNRLVPLYKYPSSNYFSKFNIGLGQNIEVNPEGAAFTGKKLFGNMIRIDAQTLKILKDVNRFVDPRIRFKQETELGLLNKTVGYIRGVVEQDRNGKLSIRANEISFDDEVFLGPARRRWQVSLLLLSFSIGLCIGFGIYKIGAEYSPKVFNHSKCKVCRKNVNVILVPCYHMIICRSCVLHRRFCPTCHKKISEIIQIKN